ncbi:hypothetical protein ACU686_20125 [Yinghuangia aomiensis]
MFTHARFGLGVSRHTPEDTFRCDGGPGHGLDRSGGGVGRGPENYSPSQGCALLIVKSWSAGEFQLPYRVDAVCGANQCGGDVLKLTAVSPNTAPRNTTATLTLTGTVLQRTDTVRLTRTGKADLPVTVTGADLDGTSSTGTVNLTAAAFGSWNVVVKSADGTERVLANAFTVVATSRDQLTPQEDGSKWEGTKGRTPIKPA